jgi:hypothetical protein
MILWIIAGLIIGWVTPELLVAIGRGRITVPATLNFGLAFVGGLVAYTILR